jgi:tetrahydromethanopterin S-methyltransferase subunit B
VKPANDEIYELAETAKEWFFGLCVTVGALTMFAIALGVTL